MAYRTLKINAEVVARTNATSNAPHAIYEGLFPNLFVEGKHHPSKIARCERRIEPGDRGFAEIWMEDSILDPSNLASGATFQLRSGPNTPIADCRIVSIELLSSKRN